MSNSQSKANLLLILILFSLFALPLLAESSGHSSDSTRTVIGLGEPLNESDLIPYQITVYPDGKNLPKGKGSVEEGAVLYENQCMTCHGESGIEGPAARLSGSDGWLSFSDPLRILRIKKYPILLISVGSLWPYATSIFDYVRRAMPHQAPKSLSNDEVYALTAYILYINGLIDENQIIDQSTITDTSMPGKNRSVLAWPESQSYHRLNLKTELAQ